MVSSEGPAPEADRDQGSRAPRPARIHLHGETARLAPYHIGTAIAGRFEVCQVLPGGMAWVFVVYDIEDRVPRVLKTPKWEAVASDESRRALEALFIREANTWVDLGNHPCIVRARWVRPLAGRPFLALEYVAPPPGAGPRSVTLADDLNGAPLPLSRVLRLSLEICQGLQHAHSHGVS
ncbi:MAG: hypothetical protein IMF16_08410, partial [Proteobacteria bacterium]|nr:hypothetical protein [Pseudomonadota bacterium]